MKKRLFRQRFYSVLLSIALVLSFIPVMPAQAAKITPWDGESKEEPEQIDGVYQIGNGAELAWFAAYINEQCEKDEGLVRGDAVLTEDINLGGCEWTPISNASYITDAYAGTFDGQNHTVSELEIHATATSYGLFGSVNTGTIKNLKVKGTVNSNHVAGGIIGKLQTGTVENCSMEGSVTTTGTGSKGYVGGIIGMVNAAGAVVKGCYNGAAVTGAYAGGIIGYDTKAAETSYCYNAGNITGTNRSGGIAGQQNLGSISYCYSIGTSVNGISGFSNAAITNCYYLSEKTEDDTSPAGGTAKYEAITDKDSLLENLNAGSEKLFCADTENRNEGFPVLNWQMVSEVISVPVRKVQILGDARTGNTLAAQALGENEESATNVKYQWGISEDGAAFTDITGETGSTFTIPDTSEYAGRYLQVKAEGEEQSEAAAAIGPISKSDALIAKENRERVKETKGLLSLDNTVIKEAGDLKLPNTLNGCDIMWESSNTDIITNAGVVTLPDKNIVTVTLTANIRCAGESDTKTFSVDVWAKDVDPDVYLGKVLDSLEWDFKLLQPVYGEDTNILVKFKKLLSKKGYDGVRVTIQSTEDESLISKNGKITYPVIPEGGSLGNGKQVQVFFGLTVGETTVTYPTSNIWALLVPWDTGNVGQALEKAADAALTEEVISGDNENLSSVVTDLTLPSYLEGDKYSFGWISWSSSDEAHLTVSDENRKGGADSLYNPYTGKVYQDKEPHTVTLTAAIKNPSTEITVKRSYIVTILPASEEKLEQTMSTMSRILDCYTADKLKDYTTKEKLDLNAVKHDIQLVIPREVVTKEELAGLDYGNYWDYWNYKFTVSSSDEEVIEVNGFRAYVYRPLGEDSSADRQVTLTVKMESKTNPNLYVTKEITVTAAHLTRGEIREALALMDAAKTGYAEGLLGSNADTYSIIDDLTPYKEIVWNSDKSGVEYVYSYAEGKNNGIIVDELPGWEEQEDWRLFHSSNRELLSNETLILNATPAEDTFVKINSVLTDEIFGKYYTKFKEDKNYDPEALVEFRQLYKQPVSAYVMAVGSGNYTDSFSGMSKEAKAGAYAAKLNLFKQELDTPISVSFTLLGRNGETIIEKTRETSFTKGATVFDVFQKVLSEKQIPYTAKGSYITSVNGLSEFADGDNSGWMYTVGGVFVNSYMNAQELSGGEDIVVKYVLDYTKENTGIPNPDTPEQPGQTGKPKPTVTPIPNPKPAVTPVPNPKPTVTPDNKKENKKKPAVKKKKTIKKLKLTRYKKKTKKIYGKTIKKAKVVVRIGKKKYTVTSGKKGKFTVKLKKKLKKRTKIKVTVTKSGYRKKTKTFKVK